VVGVASILVGPWILFGWPSDCLRSFVTEVGRSLNNLDCSSFEIWLVLTAFGSPFFLSGWPSTNFSLPFLDYWSFVSSGWSRIALGWGEDCGICEKLPRRPRSQLLFGRAIVVLSLKYVLSQLFRPPGNWQAYHPYKLSCSIFRSAVFFLVSSSFLLLPVRQILAVSRQSCNWRLLVKTRLFSPLEFHSAS
jgi:hypothetical protein